MSMKDYIVDSLKEMGFDEGKIERACQATQCESLQQVMEWIITKADDEITEIASSPPPPRDSPTPQPPTTSSSPPASATLKLRDQEADEAASQQLKNPEQIEAERRKLEDKIKQRRIEREEKERKEEIEREKRRRETGSEMVKAREQIEAQERIRIAQEYRKEKLEQEMHRKAVLEQIRRDREAMKQKNNSSVASQSSASPQVLNTSAASTSSSTSSAGSSSEPPSKCRIAIRLPNGQNMVHEFTPNEQLAAVRLYIILNRKDVPNHDPSAQSFSLVLPPNRSFSEEDYENTLLKLGLCPSARLIVQNQKRVNNVGYA